jgi:hypothetical protein
LTIGPKAYIIEETPLANQVANFQKLAPLKKLMSIDSMGREAEMNQVSPQFVMSSHFEEYQKPFLDEVTKKSVLNGDVVPMEHAQQEEVNRKKLVDLFRRFHFGDDVSLFEAKVEEEYIAEKVLKFQKLVQTNVA